MKKFIGDCLRESYFRSACFALFSSRNSTMSRGGSCFFLHSDDLSMLELDCINRNFEKYVAILSEKYNFEVSGKVQLEKDRDFVSLISYDFTLKLKGTYDAISEVGFKIREEIGNFVDKEFERIENTPSSELFKNAKVTMQDSNMSDSFGSLP